LGLNGLSTAAIWASLALVLANWRLVQLERLLPKPIPRGLGWVRSLSMLTLVTLLAWGIGYSNLDSVYGRLIHQFTCMTVAASFPVAFEAVFSLLQRQATATLRVSLWTVCLTGGFITAAAGYGQPIHRQLDAFGASYSIPSVANWVLFGSISMIVLMLVSSGAIYLSAPKPKRSLVRPMALGSLLTAATLINDQFSSRGMIDTPYLTVWGIWLWVMGFALAFERMTRLRVNELQARTQIAQARTSARSAFLANMSHELRTPLGGLLGLTDLLLGDESLSPRQVRLAHALHGSANRLRQLIDEVLELEKLEIGSQALLTEPFLICSWLDNVAKRAQGLVSTDEVQVEYSALPIELLGGGFDGDADRLAKALLNLIANALRHTRRGTVSVSIRLRSLTDGVADLRFTVRDTGSRIGRPDRSLSQNLRDDRLSDQLADDPNLSLALALRLTELIGGRLQLQTASGLGSTYTLSIRLPFIESEALPRHLKNLPPNPLVVDDKPRLTGLNLLVIDDHPVNRLIMTAPLEQAGAYVMAAEGAKEGLKLIEEHAFDLILIDLHMPEVDGIEAVGELRRYEAEGRCAHAERVPVIAVSADVTDRAKQRCKDAGMVGFIAKPHSRGVLIEAVAQTLGRTLAKPLSAEPALLAEGIAVVLEMVDSNHELAKEILTEHMDRTPAILRELDGALERGDHGQIALHAHTFKGSLLTLGFRDAGECARRLEQMARLGKREECGRLISQLHRLLNQVEETIQEYLQTEKGEG